jgi:hypothetical protein
MAIRARPIAPPPEPYQLGICETDRTEALSLSAVTRRRVRTRAAVLRMEERAGMLTRSKVKPRSNAD